MSHFNKQVCIHCKNADEYIKYSDYWNCKNPEDFRDFAGGRHNSAGVPKWCPHNHDRHGQMITIEKAMTMEKMGLPSLSIEVKCIIDNFEVQCNRVGTNIYNQLIDPFCTHYGAVFVSTKNSFCFHKHGNVNLEFDFSELVWTDREGELRLRDEKMDKYIQMILLPIEPGTLDENHIVQMLKALSPYVDRIQAGVLAHENIMRLLNTELIKDHCLGNHVKSFSHV